MADVLERARAIAEDVLFPNAAATDAADLVPRANLDALAAAGLYGIAVPEADGGLDLDVATQHRVVEALASGCLTTTFVWLQHRNPTRALIATGNAGLRDAWLAPLASGERRAGIALAGNRPGPPLLRAARARGAPVLAGTAPWVSGWGLVDVLLVTARDGDTVVSVLVDAEEAEALRAERLRLVAADASGTVTLRFDGYEVPAARVIGVEPHAAVLERDATGLRMNGSLALGLIDRCCRLLGPSPLDDELVAARSALDAAATQELPEARAAACELALRAANALTVAHGSRAILVGEHAERLAREALFLAVFGSRPPIKASLLRRLGAATDGA
jgi:alkylation response protein AidB-like acyl-CoA dehydrogenase